MLRVTVQISDIAETRETKDYQGCHHRTRARWLLLKISLKCLNTHEKFREKKRVFECFMK